MCRYTLPPFFSNIVTFELELFRISFGANNLLFSLERTLEILFVEKALVKFGNFKLNRKRTINYLNLEEKERREIYFA